MKQKTLDDFPEFTRIQTAVEKLRSEKAEVSTRLDQIAFELNQPREQQADGTQGWAQALEGKDSYRYGVDTRADLLSEQTALEGRLSFLDSVLNTGELELDSIRGRVSIELCRQIREQWMAEVKTILESLQRISQANASLDRLRDGLERDGIRTDSLPFSKYDMGGEWRQDRYRIESAENFPELAAAAGQGIKLKIKALNERERRFQEGAAAE